MTRTGARATLVGAIVLATALLGACGGPAGSSATPAQPSATASSSPGSSPGELWTGATVLQRDPTSAPELCVGAVLESYPPQCGGPRIVGWDWADVTDETEASGVTWVDTAYVTGTYDGDTFTLTRPPSDQPPPGSVETPAGADDFPALCEDPMQGAKASAAAGARADIRSKDALGRLLEEMHGYVGSWVSDHVAFMNVVVTGDQEAARTQMRRVWAGKLCVEQRDVATRLDMMSALEALIASPLPPSQCVGGGPGTEGRLHVSVTLADPGTVATIHRLVAPWLDPDDVVVSARLRPLTG